MITVCPKCQEHICETKVGQCCPCCGMADLEAVPVIKMRTQSKGRHEHCTLFMGVDEEHLANVGKLCMTYDEWVWFFNGLDNGQACNGDYSYEFVFERLPEKE